MANFGAFRQNKKLSSNLFFLKSALLVCLFVNILINEWFTKWVWASPFSSCFLPFLHLVWQDLTLTMHSTKSELKIKLVFHLKSWNYCNHGIWIRGYLARDFIFFGVRTKYLAHIGAKKFEFMGTICLKSLIEHYLKKESFKICFFKHTFWCTLLLIELSTDNFFGTKGQKSIDFSINNWFYTLSPEKIICRKF